MKRKLLIIGAGGHGKVLADIALKVGSWRQIAFLDDVLYSTKQLGLDVIGLSNEAEEYIDEFEVIVGIGNNSIREEMQTKLEIEGAIIPSLVHPSATIGSDVTIGSGTVIMAGGVINCCSAIGKGTIVNTGATIDHDCIVESYVHVSPGVHIAGGVTVGARSWLGIGSVVSNNVSITSDSIVGAGAVVVKNILEPGKYLGLPAKKA
ncbi:acetyltransferase [Paenibacillus sp. 598K]|uniref:acetyltransferase n=1 Tax=Paenibacillus sp. 598K TaxID=1117987 RepID=UPI000FFE6E47|nr:acetyltransferase [Paenibacillus sp. 598K]